MENLIDLLDKLNSSSLSDESKKFLREALVLMAEGKGSSHLEALAERFEWGTNENI